MKDETTSKIRLNTLGVPDVEFYRMEAERLRGEFVADQLHRLVKRLKQFFKAKVAEVQKPVVTNHSVSA